MEKAKAAKNIPPVNWTIHPVGGTEADLPNLYALVPDDGTDGIVVGEVDDIAQLVDRAARFLETCQDDGLISEHDPRLGYVWISVTEASKKYSVPWAEVLVACVQGKIPEAKTIDMGGNVTHFEFPEVLFRSWLARWREEQVVTTNGIG